MSRFLTVEAMLDKYNKSIGFIKSFRNETECQRLLDDINKYRLALINNHNSINDYTDALLERHARLLTIRVDVSYRARMEPHLISENQIMDEYYQATIDFRHLFNNMRSNSLFDDMVGYAWKLEYGLDKGFHYHLAFFYDGSKVRKDINIAWMIGEYWDTIVTRNRGIHFNCNYKKDHYQICGVGEVNYYDAEMVENLKYALEYLTKPDFYTKVFISNGRTFGRGVMPGPKTNRGRPREHYPLMPTAGASRFG
jgi:hypothetical protein